MCRKLVGVAMVLALVLGMTACKEKTTSEKVSGAVESAGKAVNDAAKATGKAVDNAAKTAGNAVEDATKK